MKKKPPPGATLIARLKEQRLAREAELARRQSGAAAEDAKAPEVAEAVPVVASDTTSAHEPAQSAPAAAKSSPVAEKPAAQSVQSEPTEHVQVTVVEDTVPDRSSQTQQMMVHTRNGGGADLLHREIDIQDLRPTTDDYLILTEEIKLAGRFAAVGLIAQGLRLARLKHENIYKDHYPTFEEYCRKEHQMSATYAYRLIRMAEMAERIAEIGTTKVTAAPESMPDPFEVMLSLGHRHLMALLPLEVETAQDLLVRGIPVDDSADSDQRVPISRATEKQIRQALKVFAGEPGTAKVVTRKPLANEKQLIPALSKLVEMLEDWSAWLGDPPPPELEAARMGRGQLLNRLAKRFRAASAKIADSLEGEDTK